MNRRTALAAGWVTIALAAAGCAPKSPAPAGSGSGPAAPSGASPAEDAPRTQAPTAPPTGDEFGFDDAAEYDDRVKVEVSDIRAARAGANDEGADGTDGQIVVAVVLITNHSSASFAAERATISGYYGRDDVGAPMVLDAAGRFGDGFGSAVAAGEQVSATVAFAVPADALGRVTVAFIPGDGARHPAVRFVGAVHH